MASLDDEPTTAGNYFVSNYPPFSAWGPQGLPAVEEVLDRAPTESVSLGLYVHLPFCRKRCDFCYFKVFTDKNAGEIRRYVEAVLREVDAYARRPRFAGGRPSFVYFGGGTPSYLSVGELRHLFDGLRSALPWDAAEEITFECEPGTLQRPKIEALRELGVTRLSLGIENFDPGVLELGNRAHRAEEIFRAYAWAREVGFPQINVDLIAGMTGESDANWRACIERTLELAPESVTVYQMEVPFNTTLYERMKDGRAETAPIADWSTKRRWMAEAFARLEQAGYTIGSAYTACKDDSVRFLYRDALWTGADMLGVGVSSFSHVAGVHFQNESAYGPYVERCERGELPLRRALRMSGEERMIREFVLQLKTGALDPTGFERKFGVDVLERFAEPLQAHAAAGWLALEGGRLVASRDGLLRIDRLLHDYFLPEHRDVRYT